MVDLDEKRVQAGGLDCRISWKLGLIYGFDVLFFCMKRYLSINIYIYVCDCVIHVIWQ